jgi:hypothetical protein
MSLDQAAGGPGRGLLAVLVLAPHVHDDTRGAVLGALLFDHAMHGETVPE